MTLLSIESSTDSPTVERVLITMADYDEIFEKEHSDKLEMFINKDTVNDIINEYGLNRSTRSIAHRGFNVCSTSVYGEPGWVIRKNSTTPEDIRLQKAKTLLSHFAPKIRNSPEPPDINVAKQALDSIEANLDKVNKHFDYSSCYDKPEPDFIHYGLLSEGFGNRLQDTNAEVLIVDEDLSRDTSDLINKVLKGNEKMINYERLLTPKKVIFNGPATIVFWRDGTKTVVKLSKNDKANPYNGFCAALAKKIFENNSKIQKIVKNAEYQVPKKCEDSCPIFETEGSAK